MHEQEKYGTEQSDNDGGKQTGDTRRARNKQLHLNTQFK